jgi:hypothetical protein
LEALVTKDSHNSSRPPSTDPPWAKRTRSLRRPSGRRPGGQAGHRGETLRLSERSDRIVEHRPRECRGCHTPLAAAHVVHRDRTGTPEGDGTSARGAALPGLRADDERRVRGSSPLGRAVRVWREGTSALPPAVPAAAIPEDE